MDHQATRTKRKSISPAATTPPGLRVTPLLPPSPPRPQTELFSELKDRSGGLPAPPPHPSSPRPRHPVAAGNEAAMNPHHPPAATASLLPSPPPTRPGAEGVPSGGCPPRAAAGGKEKSALPPYLFGIHRRRRPTTGQRLQKYGWRPTVAGERLAANGSRSPS